MTEPSESPFDEQKIDDAVLALLHLNSFQESWGGVRAWKGMDWDPLDRLHERGLISDPRSKAKSVILTEEGQVLARETAERVFGRSRG